MLKKKKDRKKEKIQHREKKELGPSSFSGSLECFLKMHYLVKLSVDLKRPW